MFPQVLAHEGEEEELPISPLGETLEQRMKGLSFLGLELATGVALFLILLAVLWKNKTEKAKWFLYLGIAVPTILATLFLAGSTVYLNLVSISGGPVHWHADFQVWACGQELDLIDPTGIANRVGSPVFHEHGDDRIHVEGVVTDLEEAELGRFFGFVGGELHADNFAFPTNEKLHEYENGDPCPDGKSGTLQAFVWRTDEDAGEFYQEKLSEPQEYVISPHGNVPPGDCLIFEFGEEKDRTDKLCSFYKVAESKGELRRR
ncbi:hypothetical protein A3J33_00665 [candidate division WWE3 bacterium RIFCSPLOWO2_02_FULL_53_10]|uniref:Uncharacterized protein n=2 Tax=Katanobacteria TaxID=422282 RepID=A0A1F4WNE3_UNCKA|nr:MAG: hypothetical protein A2890_00080 [candidate division WWE3 bacterium RIFCSPLOWO2_01_FULL_53_14]OGC70955.1 MAG: hypothetical protein A3J33_00665 [candidate division WWE3 bacterium RIFCSPLOWO2_02_FULL_53_10]